MKLTILFGIILWVCTVSVMGTVQSPINDRRNNALNRGGNVVRPIPVPRPPAGPNPLPNPIPNPVPNPPPNPPSSPVRPAPARTPINAEARRAQAGSLRSSRIAEAASSASRIAATPARGANIRQSQPQIIRSDAQRNAKILSRGIFQRGHRLPSRSQPSATAGKAFQGGYEILVYFGDGYVILYGYVFYISIQNTIDVFGTEYVVCGFSLGRVDTTICCENNLIITFGDPTIQCCSDTYYRTTTDICCNGDPYTSTEENGDTRVCCGDVYYLPASEFCCRNEPFPQEGFGCCNEIPFLTSEFCCYRNFYLFLINSGFCRPNCIEDTNYICCGGVRRPRRYYICCGDSVYPSYLYGCCNNNPFLTGVQKCCFDGRIIQNNLSCYYYRK